MFKGKLVGSKYSDHLGKVTFNDVPYDSYLIEVEESKNFLLRGQVLQFCQLAKDNKFTKLVGLENQTNSCVLVHVYESPQDEKYTENIDELEYIENAQVFLSLKEAYSSEFVDPSEGKFEIKAPKVKGRFEDFVVPGVYVVEVEAKGYEKVKLVKHLKAGEENLTVRMHKKSVSKDLVVRVLDITTFDKLTNALVKVKRGHNGTLVEGISDENGEVKIFDMEPEETLSLLIEKQGYYPCQRTFVVDVEESELVCSAMLVDKRMVEDEKKIILITYNNKFTKSFSPDFKFSDESIHLNSKGVCRHYKSRLSRRSWTCRI